MTQSMQQFLEVMVEIMVAAVVVPMVEIQNNQNLVKVVVGM